MIAPSSPRWIATSALLVALAGCSASPTPTPTPPTAAPPPSASAAPPAPPTASALAVSAAPEPPSPFFVAYEQPYAGLRIYPLGKIALAIAGLTYLDRPLRVDDQGVRADPSLLKGLEKMSQAEKLDPDEGERSFTVYSAEGDFPTSGTLTANVPGDRGGTDYSFRLDQGTWKIVHDGDHTRPFNEALYLGGLGQSTSWAKGKLLFERYGGDEKQPWHRFFYDGPTAGVVIPRFAPAPKGLACTDKIRKPLFLRASPSLDLFSVGQLCVEGDTEGGWMAPASGRGPLAVERWISGSATSTVDTLPDQRGIHRNDANTFVLARSGKDVLVTSTLTPEPGEGAATTPYVAHFDGSRWTSLSPPTTGDLLNFQLRDDGSLWIQAGDALWRRPSLAPGAAWARITDEGFKGLRWWEHTPDGALWARFGDALYQRAKEGRWERVYLPARDSEGELASFVPTRLVWMDGEVMIVSDDQKEGSAAGAALLRSRKPGSVARAPDLGPGGGEGLVRITPATAACKDVFVLLYKLARTAPVDYDFPLTRAALKGHTELGAARLAETEEAGRRYLVAFVPTLALGQSVVKIVSDKVPSSRPQLLCGKPRVKRPLRLDYRSGDLIK